MMYEAEAVIPLNNGIRRNQHLARNGSNRTSKYYHKNAKGKRYPTLNCFNVMASLVVVQVTMLFMVGFFSDSLSIHHLIGPMQYSLLTDFAVVVDNNDDDLIELEDRLASEIEDKLNTDRVFSVDGNNDAPPLDDYFSRPHSGKKEQVPLVVGGSDGSGTRAFVDVLVKLGVPMLVDDHHTMDVHGNLMFLGRGWPPLVTSVLNSTHSANYEVEDLDDKTKEAAVRGLYLLEHEFKGRSSQLKVRAHARGTLEKLATGVSYGFKAPVAMLVVPLLLQVKGAMKFLHVVRDGRDVALSKNQSPVKKFYKDMYPDAEEEWQKYVNDTTKPALAMQLWNDWNSQLLEWERKHADGKKFDFLVMRTEDLLNPERKFESLLQLADFVGSTKTPKELCCMSRMAVTDMGESGGSNGPSFSKEQLEKYRAVRGNSYFARHGMRSVGGTGMKALTPLERAEALQESQSRIPPPGMDFGAKTGEHKVLDFNERREQLRHRYEDRGFQRKARYEDIWQKVGKQTGERDRATTGIGRFVKLLDITAHLNSSKVGDSQEPNGRRRLTELGGVAQSRQTVQYEEESLSATETSRKLSKLESEAKHDPHVIPRETLSDFGNILVYQNRHELSSGKAGEVFRYSRHYMDRARGETSGKDVKKRYGKWVELLKDKPDLLGKLHNTGATGLSLFGYEPPSRFQDYRPASDEEFQCDDTVVCLKEAEGPSNDDDSMYTPEERAKKRLRSHLVTSQLHRTRGYQHGTDMVL